MPAGVPILPHMIQRPVLGLLKQRKILYEFLSIYAL